MESFRDDKLGFYVIVFRFKDEIWIHAKDICLSLGYKYYKQIIQKNVDSIDTKKPKLQDLGIDDFFLIKLVFILLLLNPEKQLKNQLIKWLEEEIYNVNSLIANKKYPIKKVYKKDYEAPKKFKTNVYKSRNYKKQNMN